MATQAERQETFESLRPTAAAAFLNGPVFGAMGRGSEAYGRALLAWQSELLRFTSARLRNDTEFGRSLIGCRDWQDAARLQQAWLSGTVQDYVDQAGRLLRLATGLGSEVAETSREEAQEVAEKGTDWAARARDETRVAAARAGKVAGRAAARSQPRRRQRRR
jgi:hypothetical protein